MCNDLLTSTSFYFQLVCTKMRIPRFMLLCFCINANLQLLDLFGHMGLWDFRVQGSVSQKDLDLKSRHLSLNHTKSMVFDSADFTKQQLLSFD